MKLINRSVDKIAKNLVASDMMKMHNYNERFCGTISCAKYMRHVPLSFLFCWFNDIEDVL